MSIWLAFKAGISILQIPQILFLTLSSMLVFGIYGFVTERFSFQKENQEGMKLGWLGWHFFWRVILLGAYCAVLAPLSVPILLGQNPFYASLRILLFSPYFILAAAVFFILSYIPVLGRFTFSSLGLTAFLTSICFSFIDIPLSAETGDIKIPMKFGSVAIFALLALILGKLIPLLVVEFISYRKKSAGKNSRPLSFALFLANAWDLLVGTILFFAYIAWLRQPGMLS